MQFGSPLKKYSLSFLIALALILCAAASFAADIPTPTPTVVKILPATGDVKDWQVYPNTLVYANGMGLTDIYDGGYELYTKNGVADAAQQMYRRKNDIATVTVHGMDSLDSAKKFFEYWRASDKKQSTYKLLNILTKAYVYTANGTANGYLYRGKCFVTVQVNIDGAQGRAVAESFLKTLSTKYWKQTLPGSK